MVLGIEDEAPVFGVLLGEGRRSAGGNPLQERVAAQMIDPFLLIR